MTMPIRMLLIYLSCLIFFSLPPNPNACVHLLSPGEISSQCISVFTICSTEQSCLFSPCWCACDGPLVAPGSDRDNEMDGQGSLRLQHPLSHLMAWCWETAIQAWPLPPRLSDECRSGWCSISHRPPSLYANHGITHGEMGVQLTWLAQPAKAPRSLHWWMASIKHKGSGSHSQATLPLVNYDY